MKDSIYLRWEKQNFPYYYNTTAYIAALMQAGLVLFDMKWFDLSTTVSYLPYRVFYASLFFLSSFVFIINEMRFHKYAWHIYTATSSFSSLSLGALYLYFLHTVPAANYNVVLTGNIMVIFAIGSYLAKFPFVSRLYFLGMFGMTLVYSVLSPQKESWLINCSVVVCFAISLAIQKSERAKLQATYDDHREMFDKHTSLELTTRPPDQSLAQIFPVRKRAVAVLCCDIRNSQDLNVLPDEEIERIEHGFFDLCKTAVDELSGNVRCFTRTHGDEFLVVLYSDDEIDLDHLAATATSMAHRMATDVHKQVNESIKSGFLFDIGVSWGINRTGFLGPSGTKKPDIRGNAVIEANRFQTQAKLARRNEVFPIIALKKGSTVIPISSAFVRSEEKVDSSVTGHDSLIFFKRVS